MTSRVLEASERNAARKLGLVLAGFLGLLLLSLPSYAQSNLGRIFGAITDQTGGAVVGAAVSVVDIARGITRPLVTDGAGLYDASSLIPGMYTVRAEAKGFKATEHTDIDVGVGKEVRVDLTLQPGEQTTTVTVTGELPMVNTANAQLGGTLENLTVQELPVNGRNYQYLAFTRPGVVMAPNEGQNDFTTDGISVGYVVWMIDGLMDSNMFISSPSLVGGAQLGPDEATILPLDAIQEVNMVENPNAQYGDRPGAHIDVGLRSGTNSVHGTAYAFGRDQALNAKNPFLAQPPGAPVLPKAPLTLEQFGASVGGPIKKDKVFFFANYEGQRYTAGVPSIRFEPTVAPGLGTTFSTPDALFDILHNGANPGNNGPANQLGIVPPSALSMNLAGCTSLIKYPGDIQAAIPNVTLGGYLTNAAITRLQGLSAAQLAAGCTGDSLKNIFGSASTLPSGQIVTDFGIYGGSDNGIIKIDVHANDKNQFNFVWYSGGGNGDTVGANGTSGTAEPYFATDLHTWANMGRAVWIWTPNSTWLNEFRFGYEYGDYPTFVLECDKPSIAPNFYEAPPNGMGLNTGVQGCHPERSGPNRDIFGGYFAQTMTGFATLGGGSVRQDGFEHYFQILDNASWTHGKHVISFGPEMRFVYMQITANTNDNGAITISNSSVNAWKSTNQPLLNCTAATPCIPTPLENFLTGTIASGTLLAGDPNRNTYYPAFGLYVQDSYRVHPRVTLNYGLRWEYSGPWRNDGHGGNNPGGTPEHSLGNFNPSLGTATDLYQETAGHWIWSQYPWNFGPRFGMAWDVFGTGKTVIHVGASVMFYSSIGGTQVLFGGGAQTYGVPTGFTFYNSARPDGFPGPGNILTGNLSLTGGVSPNANNLGSSVNTNLPWTVGNPIFPATLPGGGVNPAGFTCGDGYTLPTQGRAFNQALAVQKAVPPCQLQVIAPIFHSPYYIAESVSLQHAFTNNLTMDIAYVATRGKGLAGNVDENPPTPGAKNTAIPTAAQGGCTSANATASLVEQCRRPYEALFPFYAKILLQAPMSVSSYDALQVSVNKRLSHGLQITPAFTWAHSFTFGTLEDPRNPRGSWGQSGNPIVFTITGTYYLPSVKTPAQLLEGWQINSTVYMLGGAPTTLTDTADDLSGLGGSGTDRWNVYGNPHSVKLGGTGASVPCFGIMGSTFDKSTNCTNVGASVTNMPAACVNAAASEPINPNVSGSSGTASLISLGCYLTGNLVHPDAVIVPPAQGTLGNESSGEFYGKPYRDWDFSISKNWKFKERYTVQFRAEFFNFLNRTLVNGAGTAALNTPSSLGQNTTTPDGSNPVIGNGPRKIQLGLKIGF